MSTLRDIEHSLPLQLLKAREAAMAQFRPMLRQHGLTEQQWRVMRVLSAYPDIDATTLAQRSILLAPSLTRILKYLEQANYVARTQDPIDQRRATFSLTGAGSSIVARVAPDSEALYRQIEAQFGEDNLKTLYRLLNEFSSAVQNGSTADT